MLNGNTDAVMDMQLVGDSANEDFTEELTVDGWFNLLTGQGLQNKDKAENLDFVHVSRFTREANIRSLYRGDSIAARIIDLVVDDSLAKGWTVEFFSKDDDGNTAKLDPVKAAELNSAIAEWGKTVELKKQVELFWKRGRAYGGALMVFGVDDSSMNKRDPLNLDTVKSFDWLRPLTRFEVSAGAIATDPKQPEIFGKPEYYNLHSRVVASEELAFGMELHASRGMRFEGIRVDELAAQLDQIDGWGDSVFERVWVPLRNWNSAVNSAGSIIQDFSQSIYSIKGLRQILRANQESLIQKQFAMQDVFRSIWNATVIDADDTYERKTTSVQGMPDLIDRFGFHLSAASGMPLTLLLGISPGGFGTGESEGSNWDKIVEAAQTSTLVPILESIYKVLFATPEFKGKVPDAWKIVPVPLVQKSESDQAEIQNKQADTDNKYIDSGVLDAEEVAQSRFGKGEFSLSTTLDNDTREDFETKQRELEDNDNDPDNNPDSSSASNDVSKSASGIEGAEGTEEAKPADEAMNGAQVKGLMDIVIAVAAKTLPRASAIAILQVAYKLSPADAASVVGADTGEGFNAAEAEAETEENKRKMEEQLEGAGKSNASGNDANGPSENEKESSEKTPTQEEADEVIP